MERNQRRFGHRTRQDKHDGGGNRALHGSSHERPGLVKDGRNPVRSCGLAQNDESNQHGKATCCGDHQGLKRRSAGGQAGPGITDQQVGQDGGELPENEEHQKVIRGDQSEHGSRKSEQLGSESTKVRIFVLEVSCAIDQHQRTDTEDEQGHHPCQGVHTKREFQLQAGNPREDLFHAASGICGSILEEQPHERTRGHGGQDVERIPAQCAEDQGRHSCRYKGDGENCEHCFLRKVRNELSKVGASGHTLGSVYLVYQGARTVIST